MSILLKNEIVITMNKREWNGITFHTLQFGNNSHTLIGIQSKLLKKTQHYFLKKKSLTKKLKLLIFFF
jgi:hypothetical protein